MANVYTISAIAIPFLLNRSMIGIFNGVGSGKIVKIYKVIALNNQTVAITGVAMTFELRLVTTGSGGFALSPIKHDSLSPNIPSQISFAADMSYTNSSLLRKVLWSTDEPIQATVSSIDEWETIPSLNLLWETSYKDTNIQPLTLREGQGFSLNNVTTTNVGVADFFIEFTVE